MSFACMERQVMTAGGRRTVLKANEISDERGEVMNESVSLRDATVQDIQVELLRRSCWNALDGERVHASQEIDRALGTGRQEYGVLSIWWD